MQFFTQHNSQIKTRFSVIRKKLGYMVCVVRLTNQTQRVTTEPGARHTAGIWPGKEMGKVDLTAIDGGRRLLGMKDCPLDALFQHMSH